VYTKTLLIWNCKAGLYNTDGSGSLDILKNRWFLSWLLLHHSMWHGLSLWNYSKCTDSKLPLLFISVTSLPSYWIIDISCLVCVLENSGEVHPYCLPVLVFDEELVLWRLITSSFVFRLKHFCFIVLIRIKHSSNNIPRISQSQEYFELH
jgi:hypothetical protein